MVTIHGLPLSAGRISADSWATNIIGPLAKKVKARLIVIESCYGSTLIPVFSKLLDRNGIIIAHVGPAQFSIPVYMLDFNHDGIIDYNEMRGGYLDVVKNLSNPASPSNQFIWTSYRLTEKDDLLSFFETLFTKKEDIPGVLTGAIDTYFAAATTPYQKNIDYWTILSYAAPNTFVIYENNTKTLFCDATLFTLGKFFIRNESPITTARNLAVDSFLKSSKRKDQFPFFNVYGQIIDGPGMDVSEATEADDVLNEFWPDGTESKEVTWRIWGSDETLEVTIQPKINYGEFTKGFMANVVLEGGGGGGGGEAASGDGDGDD